MNRRDTVIALLGLSVAPLAARAQQPAKPARVAWFGFGTAEAAGHQVDAFKQGLRDLGYAEGKNVIFEIRWALAKAERVPDLTRELVALKPDVILSGSAVTARAVQKATTTIPIVLVGIPDPVGGGFVKSLGNPGGNITGVSSLATDTSPKLLELLLAVMPKLARVAVLWNPSNVTHAATLKNIQSAAHSVGVNVHAIGAQTPAEIESAFVQMGRENLGAVIVPADSLFMTLRRQVTELASRNRIPSIFAYREQVQAGGLMSYGASAIESYRRAATYVAKILKGAKPGDLPVEQATILELVINLKTAKALGLTIPQSVLIRADDVIQ